MSISFLPSSSLVPLVGAVALLVLGVLKWRVAVIIALILAVFEGALRKWVLPEFGQWIYFAKDLLVIGAYVGFWGPRVVRRQRRCLWHPANGLLVAFSVLAVLELANPLLPSLLLGVFGIKSYLIYVPLMYMAPFIFPDVQELGKFWYWYLILAVIPLALGVIQFGAPADSVLNRYAWDDEVAPVIATFGSITRARITGTFTYITGYTTYLTLVFLMAMSSAVSEGRKQVRCALYGVLGLSLANLFMTGSRGPFLTLGASLVILLALTRHSSSFVRRHVMVTVCVVLPLVGLLASNLFPEALTAFQERAQQNEDLQGRLAEVLYNPVWALAEAGPFGYGLGSAHQARAFVISGDTSDNLPPDAEGEWERIILEVGPVGFTLVLLTRIFVASQLWRALQASQGMRSQPFLIAAFLFSLLSIPGNLVFNHTASIFYWFLAGFGLMAKEGAPLRAAQTTRAVGRRNEVLREHAR
jgi:hypothetical protein